MEKIYNILIRYILIFILGLGKLIIFYKVFFFPTFFGSTTLLSLFGDVYKIYSANYFIYNTIAVNLINACIAGSAYYLLFILLFSTPEIKINQRIKILVIIFLSFLVLNIIRIVLMTLLIGNKYFKEIHLFFWYVISTLFVICIWFSAVKIFKIKEIPIYSDLKYLLKVINKK